LDDGLESADALLMIISVVVKWIDKLAEANVRMTKNELSFLESDVPIGIGSLRMEVVLKHLLIAFKNPC
jgi:hypothetical protein